MLHLNPDLKLFRVSYRQVGDDEVILYFDCYATNSEHAMEQAENAYPGFEILHVAVFEHANPSNHWVRNALEQVCAALPDASFAKQDGIDPELIHRINEDLASNDTDETRLKQLFIESREVLPVAWKNHGGIPVGLFKLIDGFAL